MQLDINNVINISVSESETGLGEYNTSNLAIFSDEIPANSFGTLGYANYLSPVQVGVDFGTTSKTYAMANAVFSQTPNILTGSGELTVILIGVATQQAVLSGIPASGAFEFVYSATPTASIAFGDTAAMIQAKLRAIPALAAVVVTGSLASETLTIKMAGVYGASPALLSVTSNTLQTSGSTAITFAITNSSAGEALGDAITRTVGLVQYFGILVDQTVAAIGQTDVLAAAAIVQPLNKIIFFVSHTEADIQAGGMLDLLRTGSLTKSRGLYYGDSSFLNCIVMAASYAGRALSTDFSGSNTTATMHLKTLVGVQPDPTITQTVLNEAKAAGADTYVSIQGVPKVFCVGANMFFDQVYNLAWLTGALQIAAFNYLAESNTKIPQTESGMDGFKGALRVVMEQGVTNQYLAPGAWNSSTTFGSQADLIANVSQRGYYIYSQPISQQSQVDRVARKAPLSQIAAKEAGAIQSASIIVNINA